MGLFRKQDKVKQKLLKSWVSEDELLALIPLMDSSDAFHLVRHSQATSKVLVEALKYLDEVDARHVFSHPKIPVREMRTWANRYINKWNGPVGNFTTLEYTAFQNNMESILGNPNCPTDILDNFLSLIHI